MLLGQRARILAVVVNTACPMGINRREIRVAGHQLHVAGDGFQKCTGQAADEEPDND